MNEFRLIVKPDGEEPEAAEVFVDGTVGGKAYRFLLDTGAARSSLALDDYTATFNSTEKNDSSGVFARTSDDVITVPDLEVGPISRRDLTLVRAANKNPHIGNLIGMDLLKDLRCHFMFDENRVVVNASDGLSANSDWQDLFLDKKFHPYIDVQFGAAAGKAVWDTGASITVVDLGFIKNHLAFFHEAGQSSGTDASGATLQTPMFVMSGAAIGGSAFPPHKVAGVDLTAVNATIEVAMDLIVGYSTYRHANWLFDFPGKKWAIIRGTAVDK